MYEDDAQIGSLSLTSLIVTTAVAVAVFPPLSVTTTSTLNGDTGLPSASRVKRFVRSDFVMSPKVKDELYVPLTEYVYVSPGTPGSASTLMGKRACTEFG